MTVLDGSALMAALLGEPAKAEVETILRSTDDQPGISAANLAEVIDGLTRVARRPLERVEEAIDWLIAGGLITLPVTEAIGRSSGALRAAHYHRTECPLSLADCIALATAIASTDALATTDPALAATARKRGVAVVALPDSGGVRP